MTRQSDIHWKRIAAEAVAVFGSILLAFWIDAWWDDRQERAEEANALQRLRVEFETINAQIEDSYSAGLPAAVQIYEIVSTSLDENDDEVEIPVVLLSQMTVAPTYDAPMTVLDGLIRSGRLEIIRDQSVIDALSEWSQRYSDYYEMALRTRRNLDTNLLPELRRRADIGDMMMHNRGPIRLGQTKVDHTDVIVVRADEELKGLIAERRENGRVTSAQLNQSRRAAISVIEAVTTAQSDN